MDRNSIYTQNKAYFAEAFKGIWSSLMPQVWFPAPKLRRRWLSALISLVVAVAAYLGVYAITQSVGLALFGGLLIYVSFVAVLNILLRRKPG